MPVDNKTVSDHIFNEIYGTYFNVVAKILDECSQRPITRQDMYDIVRKHGYKESSEIVDNFFYHEEEDCYTVNWPLINTDSGMTPVLYDRPVMPLTLLQKQWLKALLLDKRIHLFLDEATIAEENQALAEVEPLFTPDQFVFFDNYNDGDTFDKPEYIENFRKVLKAIQEKCYLDIDYDALKGIKRWHKIVPLRLEYSLKDDKFRLLTGTTGYNPTLNLAKFVSCSIGEPYKPEEAKLGEVEEATIELELFNERNALERVLLHFSHLKKETVKLDDKRFYIKLTYDKADETEMVIRVLSFGPMLKVLKPEGFVKKIKARLLKQQQL